MQKQVSILIGIIIIGVAVVIIFGGVFVYQYFSKSQIPMTNVQPNLNVQDQNTETADWKTYTNTQSGFEFKYPPNWKLEQPEGGITLKSPDFDYLDAELDSRVLSGSVITIIKPRLGAASSVEEYINNMRDVNSPSYEEKKIKIDNVDGIEFYYQYEGPKKLFTNFIKDDYFYQIIFEGVGEEREDRDYPVLEQILSTFKFTTPTGQATDWTKYNQDELMAMVDKNWNNEAMYFKGLEGNFLIIDQGTAPDPRGLIVYDLSIKKKVLSDRYSKPLDITGTTVSYWTPTNQTVTDQNCPERDKWAESGLGAHMESRVSFDLVALTKKDLGGNRCLPTQ